MMERKIHDHRIMPMLPVTLVLLIILSTLSGSPVMAAEQGRQKSFTTPQQAVEALVAAVAANDDAELLSILGPGSEDLIHSGDTVEDQHGRARFLKVYEEKNSIAQEADDRMVLYVGPDDYPFPIPIISRGSAWSFDTRAGMDEILNRRVGRNELNTIKVMQAYTDAQREYASKDNSGSVGIFAQKIISSEGQQDGLYWPTAEGEKESPLGPLIALAVEEGYEGAIDQEPPEPFHGYYFKVLTRQGEHAKGGAYDYVVNGKMILGFGLVAYPAKYGASGIMTFTVNQEGIIYEKDLGTHTATEAAAMTTFDPDNTWHQYEESTEQ